MKRSGRAPNQQFNPDEKLYFRITPEKWANVSHESLGFLFRVGDQSVNRSWPDGEWEDVLLWEYPKNSDCGVLQFEVRDLPPPHNRGEDIDSIEGFFTYLRI